MGILRDAYGALWLSIWIVASLSATIKPQPSTDYLQSNVTSNVQAWPIPGTDLLIRNTNTGPPQDWPIAAIQTCLSTALSVIAEEIRTQGRRALTDSHLEYKDTETKTIVDIRVWQSMYWEVLLAIIQGFKLYFEQVLARGIELHFEVSKSTRGMLYIIATGRIGWIGERQDAPAYLISTLKDVM